MSTFKLTPKFLIRMIALGASTFIYATPYIIWTFYMPLFNAFDVDYAQFGMLMTMFGFAALPCYFIGGWIADRFDPAKLVSFSLVASGILGLFYATLPSFYVVMGIQFLLAIFTIGTYWPATLKLVKLLSIDLGEGKGFASWEMFRKFANVGLAALEIIVFTRFGEAQTGLAAALVFNSVVIIILGILLFFSYRGENLNDLVTPAKEKVNFKLIIPLLKKPAIWIIGLIIFMIYAPSAMQGNLSGYAVAALQMTEAQSAWIVQFGNLGAPFLLPFVGILTDKVGAGKSMVIATLFAILAIIFMIIVPGNPSFLAPAIVSIILFLTLLICVRGVYWVLVGYAKIPPLVAGTAIGVISFIGFLPDLFIYNLAGSFLDKDPIGGYKTIFYMITICLILAVLLTLALMRYLKGRKPEDMYGDIHDYAKEAAKAANEA